MERHSLTALASIALLIVLSWVGIGLVAKLHDGGGVVALFVVWLIVMASLLALAIRSLMLARQARLQRRSERTVERL